MEILELVGTTSQYAKLFVNLEKSKELLIIMPFMISFLTESVKNIALHLGKPLDGKWKTNVQAIFSIIGTLMVMYVAIEPNADRIAILITGGLCVVLFAKLSSYLYKGFPLQNVVPVVKDVNLNSLYQFIYNTADKIVEANQPKEIA